MFSSRSFVASHLMFRSLIHFEFIFVYGVRKCSSFILLQAVDQFSQHHLLKRLSFLHCLLPLSKIRCPSDQIRSDQSLRDQIRSVAQSCPTLCDPMDCSTPGSSVHGILQARILEWVAISFFRGSSRPRDRTQVSTLQADALTSVPPGKLL